MTTIAREMVEERVRRMLVHDFVRKEVDRAGFGGLSIQRTPLGTHVRILAERPGIVIGRKGVDINRLTEELSKEPIRPSRVIIQRRPLLFLRLTKTIVCFVWNEKSVY